MAMTVYKAFSKLKNIVDAIKYFIASTIQAMKSRLIINLCLSLGTLLSCLSYPDIGIGTLRYAEFTSDDDLVDHLHYCARRNITILDTADVYGWYTDGHGRMNEKLGRAFRLAPELRQHFKIIAKFGIRLGPYHVDLSDEWIDTIISIYTDELHYIDVFMVHNPPQNQVVYAGLARKFSLLHQQNRVSAFGVSNFSPAQYTMLRDNMKVYGIHISYVEMEVSALHPGHIHDGWLAFYKNQTGLSILAWGPLGGEPNGNGNLLFEKGRDPKSPCVLEFLSAHQEGNGIDVVAVSWVLSQGPHIIPLLGTTRRDRLDRQKGAVPNPQLQNVFPLC
jgi:predicted oxidoreductase